MFLSCLPASEHFRSDVGKTKEGSIPPLVYSIADRSDKQVSPPSASDCMRREEDGRFNDFIPSKYRASVADIATDTDALNL